MDDVRTNFQSGGTTAKKVFRCCKVARCLAEKLSQRVPLLNSGNCDASQGYDAPSFRDMGFVRDMGGIGAHNEEQNSCNRDN